MKTLTQEPGYERDAFEAGAGGRFRTFNEWYSWFFVCTDCHQDTAKERIHQCPARTSSSATLAEASHEVR
jgi:hypothetical protein